MRRLAAISAFALLLALPLWAQHGGGHGGGGGHAGGGGGHVGSSGGHSSGFSGGGHAAGFSGGTGVHAYSGPRSGSAAPRAFSRPPSSSFSRPFSRPPISQNRFRGSGVRNYGFRNNCYGYACRGYGYYYPWASGYYDPYWWWDSGSSDDSDNGYNQDVAAAAEMNRENLAEQGEQQQMMSQEQADGDQDLYARVPMRPAMHEAQGAPVLPDTVLVFRDEHKQEIRNYAIVGQTLWNFAPQHTQKIPLSDLDLPATTKANEDRGLTFRVPAGGEAQ